MKQKKLVIVFFILIIGILSVGCGSNSGAADTDFEKDSINQNEISEETTSFPTVNQWINDIGYPAFSEHFNSDPDYHFVLEATDGGALLTITYDGLVNSLHETNMAEWKEIEEAIVDLSETGHYSLISYGVDSSNTNFIINLENDLNSDKVILSVMNGEIIYSISED